MTPVLIALVVSSLMLQGHCQGVTQHPEINWSLVSKSAEMNCSHNKDAGHNQMYWYRQRPGETMTLVVYTVFGGQPDYGKLPQTKYSAVKESSESGALTVKDLQLEDAGVYFCAVSKGQGAYEAYFGQGTKLTVLEPGLNVTKPKVKVLRPSARECGNPEDKARKTIVCVASGFYPDHVGILWNIDGQNVTDRRVATDNAALRVDQYYRITSRLSVPAEEWFTEGKNFTCTVSFFNGKNTESYQSSTIGEKDKRSSMTKEKYLMVTQTARFSYIIFIFKSSIYGAFVAFLVWRLQRSAGKQND